MCKGFYVFFNFSITLLFAQKEHLCISDATINVLVNGILHTNFSLFLLLKEV